MAPDNEPLVTVVRHANVLKDLKRLRRFRTIEQSLEYFERLLSTGTPNLGVQMQGFPGRVIMKGDLHLVKMGAQGRGAGRVIYEKSAGLYTIIYVYAKNEDNSEAGIKEEIRARLRD